MNKEMQIADLFRIGIDFSQTNVLQFIFTLIASLFLGLSFSFIYKSYFRENEPVEASIGRSFPLMSPAVTTIFWLIQYSLPLSLGLLGALSFVRFRTPVKRAEDIAFILLLIAGSLACAVGQFLTAIALVVLVALYGLLRNRIPNLQGASGDFAVLTINLTVDIDVQSLEEQLKKEIKKLYLVSSTVHDGITSYVFNIPHIKSEHQNKIIGHLSSIDPQVRVDLFFPANLYGSY